MTVIGIVQARLTSSRLPKKVFAKIGSRVAIELMFKRISKSKAVDKFIFAIPNTQTNDELAEFIQNTLQAPVIRGNENDVLTRFMQASQEFPAEYYVRLTADCPFMCPEIIDRVVRRTVAEKLDYCSNVNPPTFPDGFDVECFSSRMLIWSNINVKNLAHREHVTYGFRIAEDRPQAYKIGNITNENKNCSWMRLTLDEEKDLKMFQQMANYFANKLDTVQQEELETVYSELNLQEINGRIMRNEGLAKSLNSTAKGVE